MSKLCKRCKEIKEEPKFTKDSRARDGLSTYCKDCHNQKNRDLYAAQGDYARDKFNDNKKKYYRTPKGGYSIYISDVKRKYAKEASVAEFDIVLQHLLFMQKGCCAVCGVDFSELPEQYHIDHDHATGEIRDLLCNKCNIQRGA